jgi:hypothetical protein
MEGGLYQRSKVRSEPPRVDLTERLIEQPSDPAELADHGVIRAWYRRDVDTPIEGELPGQMVGRKARVLRSKEKESVLSQREIKAEPNHPFLPRR